ncbi:MAG TPA: hypothetical protein DCF47_02000, partial [Kandleria vitulina]|nr:hypothetical protein [Kandleria vitulina]
MDNLQVRMYLFTGFLESGKSTFINDTIVNTNFTDGERSVLIVTEEGEVEYKKEELEAKGTHMIVVEDPEEFTLDFWNKIKEDYDPTQILIEFNGMWDVDKFIEKERPDGWQIVQILTTINASTFQLFVQNMRALLFQHCSRSDLVIFNRLPKGAKKRPYRNNIKAMNPQCQIIYELEDGTVDNNVEEELPYNYEDHDLNIEDHDFGIFCYDLMEHPERYDNKHIRIKGKFIGKDRVQENGFVLGRYAMVCCEQDTSLIGLICISKEYRDRLIPNEWIIVEGDTHTQY